MGYTFSAGKLNAYHGYYYRILKSQGTYAPGGKKEYVVNGKMTSFALLAWPAEYGNTGISTFLVSDSGVVYSADMGKGTETTAAAITSFDPDDRWTVVPTMIIASTPPG